MKRAQRADCSIFQTNSKKKGKVLNKTRTSNRLENEIAGRAKVRLSEHEWFVAGWSKQSLAPAPIACFMPDQGCVAAASLNNSELTSEDRIPCHG